jgi:hypothetical protein
LKRIVSGILAVLFAAVWCPAALAAGSPTLSVSSGEVSPGGDVTLTVSIQDNPGLAAMLVYIYYDTTAFTLSPDDDIATAGAFRGVGGLVCNTIQAARESGRYNGDESQDGALALWYNGSGMNTTGDGPVLTVTLHAKSGAAAGSYTVGLGYSQSDTCDQDSQDVVLQTQVGTVTVTGSAQKPTGNTQAPDDAQTPDETPADTQPDAQQPETQQPGGDQKPDGTQTPSGTQKPGQETQQPDQEVQEPEPITFTDVAEDHWAGDYIAQAAQLGLMEGYDGRFRPDDGMTRGELVTILWRASGSPAPQGAATFTDLDANQTWYLDAIAWAQETGVVQGVGNDRFDPDGGVSREQLATVLYRLSGAAPGMEAMLTGVYDSQFTDSAQVDDWAKQAVYWTVFQEIYCGEGDLAVGAALTPASPADRAQIAVMMVRYLSEE